jgi:hypothetical protein
MIGDPAAQARQIPRSGDPPDLTEERVLLAGVSAAAAVAGQTHKHAISVGERASPGRPLAVPWSAGVAL